jgi:hypothetical protein
VEKQNSEKGRKGWYTLHSCTNVYVFYIYMYICVHT